MRFWLGFFSCLFVLGVAGWVAATLGILPVSAKVDPPRLEKKIAFYTLGKSIARRAIHEENPLPVNDANLKKGMDSYRDHCATCHGDALNRSKWGATSFYPRVPQFGRRAIRIPDSEIFWIEKNGIRYSGMASFEPLLTDKEMWQVAMFLRHLDSLPPKLNTEWHTSQEP